MGYKEKDVVIIFILAALLFMVFDCLTGKAGNLEPTEPPGQTMVTLDQLSSQIDGLSSPVQKVVRGVIEFDKNITTEFQILSSSIDPNHSVVLLSDAVALDHDGDTNEWISRTGTCLTNLTETAITVQVELLPTRQKVSYQIIEYK